MEPDAAAEADFRPRLSYVVGRLDRALRRALDERLAPLGLTTPQYTALSVLAQRTGLSNAQLARRTYVTPQSMIEVTSALERAGLIERAPSAGHARVLESRLTTAGRRRLAAGDEAVDALEAEMLSGLSPRRADALREDMLACVRALRGGLDA